MSKSDQRRGPDRAQTKAALRRAVADVKGAAGIRSTPQPAPRLLKDGVNWLVALGAGAAVAWKSWQVATSPAPKGGDNATAKRFNAELERAERRPTEAGNARLNPQAQRSTKSASEQAVINAALESARHNRLASDNTARTANTARHGAAATGDTKRVAPDSNTDLGHSPENGDAPDPARKIESGAWALGKEFYKRFNEDEVTTRAAALAFVGVFSLVPLLLFAVVALGFVFRDPAEATKHVQQFVAQMLPGESASRAANEVLAQTHLIETAQNMTRHAGWPLVIGIGSLLWAGTTLFVTAAMPMNAAWRVTETRNVLKLRLTAAGVLFGAGLIFVLSIAASALPRILTGLSLATFGLPVPAWVDALSVLVAITLDALMFVLIYKFLPNVRVTWKAALFSGVVTGLLWELLKQGFTLYLARFGDSSNKLYGALGGVFLLITWIYYSCTVLLAGAEIGKMYHEHKEEGGVAERPQDAPAA